MSDNALPPTQRALLLTSFDQPPAVETVTTPQPTPGSAVLKVLSTGVLPYAKLLYNGSLGYPLALPQVIGGSLVGRVAALAPDATSLNIGQLVLVDSFIHSRDDPSGGTSFLFGTHAGITPGSQKLMRESWRDAGYAEYCKVPLENLHVLNEDVLCSKNGSGYSVHELAYLLRMIVPMGGLCELDVRPGEKVIIAPATGAFGGAAVEIAVALGCTVIAAGRNEDSLATMAKLSDRVKTVKLSGTVEDDSRALQQFGAVDAYLDFSPAVAKTSTHIVSCLMSLRNKGRACFMGGIQDPVPIPYGLLMFKSLKVSGKFMFERQDVERLIAMAENGLVKLGSKAGLKVAGEYRLEDWEEAFDAAGKYTGWGIQVVFDPAKK